MALKLDMEKAYDKLNWNFIEAILTKFGFHKTWIKWTMACIRNASFSVLVNNVPGKPFSPSRGIRQGDPLSPYIFVIAMEYLARKLQAESLKPKSDIGIKLVPRSTSIPFLSFADDTLILAKANYKKISTIKEILNEFAEKSGLNINFGKSSIQFSKNIENNEAHILAAQMNIPITRSLEKYLGIPIIIDKVNNVVFNNAINNLNKQLTK